jgi:dTDP-4-amino-4,6-dideoxygalactose transaminase
VYPFRISLAAPYWNGDTYRAIVGALLHGNFIEGPDLHLLEASLIERLSVAGVVLCGSGSLALDLALRLCGVQADDEVIIPAFGCSAVVPPILALGAVPVLADIGAELNLTAETVGAVTTRNTKAVVVPHLFGNPADIGSIVELARQKNIRVIDDAAQALGATFDDRPLGSFGDAGIVSFGKEKVCFGIGGGAVAAHPLLSAADCVQALTRSRRTQAFANLAAVQFNWCWRRWTRPLQIPFQRNAKSGPAVLPVPYRQETMANLQAAVALSLMQTLNENIAARRARVRLYRKLLGGEDRLELIEHRSGSACLTQVVRLLPKGRDRDPAASLIVALGAAGYEVQGSYVPIHLLPCFKQCVWDALPRTERLWADLIELPCEPSVSLIDVERIASVVAQFCRAKDARCLRRNKSTVSTASG